MLGAALQSVQSKIGYRNVQRPRQPLRGDDCPVAVWQLPFGNRKKWAIAH